MEPTIFGLLAAAALIATRYYYRGIIAKRDEEIRLLTLKVNARDVNIEYVYKCNRVLEKENKLLLEIRTVALNKQLRDELDASKQTIERLQAVITKADRC